MVRGIIENKQVNWGNILTNLLLGLVAYYASQTIQRIEAIEDLMHDINEETIEMRGSIRTLDGRVDETRRDVERLENFHRQQYGGR